MEISSIKRVAYAYFKPNLKFFFRLYKLYLNNFRSFFKLYDSESKLASDAQKYWNRDYTLEPRLAQDAHWNDKGIFSNQERWYKLGKEHLDLLVERSSVLDFQFPVKQIVEWGCGGGANAVHFAAHTEKFIGVEIAPENLEECNRQLKAFDYHNFKPVLIDASAPDSFLDMQINDVDLFICTYVFELFPSQTYGVNVLSIANEILKPGGIAFIQIRYNDHKNKLKSKKWGYKMNLSFMTTYSLEEFWNYSNKIGLEPVSVYLKPKQPLVDEHSYAYYFLKKK